MKLHHSKHHQTYVNNLNKATQALKELVHNRDVAKQIELQSVIKFNGGGHINHSLFWQNLAPANDAAASGGKEIKREIERQFDSFDKFESQLTAALLGIQGSGWGWLVKQADGSLTIETTKDQDPIVKGAPLLGIDFWEHAYYIQYYNDKQSYVNNIYKVINWDTVEKRWNGTAHALKL